MDAEIHPCKREKAASCLASSIELFGIIHMADTKTWRRKREGRWCGFSLCGTPLIDRQRAALRGRLTAVALLEVWDAGGASIASRVSASTLDVDALDLRLRLLALR